MSCAGLTLNFMKSCSSQMLDWISQFKSQTE